MFGSPLLPRPCNSVSLSALTSSKETPFNETEDLAGAFTVGEESHFSSFPTGRGEFCKFQSHFNYVLVTEHRVIQLWKNSLYEMSNYSRKLKAFEACFLVEFANEKKATLERLQIQEKCVHA